MTADSVGAAARLGKQLTRQEAEQILGIEAGATWEEISKVRGPLRLMWVGYCHESGTCKWTDCGLQCATLCPRPGQSAFNASLLCAEVRAPV